MINPWLTSAKILHNHYLQFLLGTAAVPKNDGYSFSSFLACEGRGGGGGGGEDEGKKGVLWATR